MQEWPHQRLDWEMYRIEHLAYASNMETSLKEWLQYPWHIGYAALRSMACQNWQTQHACPTYHKTERNKQGGKDPWGFISGCHVHLQHGSACLGSVLNSELPATTGQSMIPSTAVLLKELHPDKSSRDLLPPTAIIYVGSGGHRQWPMSIVAMPGRFSLLISVARKSAIAHLKAAVKAHPN